MNRLRLVDALSWGASLVILLALLLGLDSYRRPRLEYGYGPDRRQYFAATLERARQLQDKGSADTDPVEAWHLLGGWTDELSEEASPQAWAVRRRARLVLPVLVPEPLRIRLPVAPLWPNTQEAASIELEYGVNGIEVGRFTVPPQGAVLKFRIDPSMLHRGDNIVYLYRVSRRSDPLPWLAVGRMKVRAVRAAR